MAKIDKDKQVKSYEELPLMMDVQDVRRVLSIDQGSAYNLMNSKYFPTKRINRRLRVFKDEFFKWCKESGENIIF